MKGIKKLWGFFWHRSLGIFLIIGGINTLLSYFISFALGAWAGLGLFPSTLIPYAVLSVPSFYFNRKYSFKSKAPLGPSALRFGIIITVCYFLSFGLNHLVVPWMREHWFPGIGEIPYMLLRLLGIQAVFTILNYIGQRLWAFKAPEEAL